MNSHDCSLAIKASNENTVDAEASPDWRRFRARLLEREAALTEATEGVFTEQAGFGRLSFPSWGKGLLVYLFLVRIPYKLVG